jgi:uncharacterized protein YutE (UPF0331/DUF86 family)
MVDVNVVSFKLGELKDRMERVRSHCPDRPEDFVADRDALDIVSFNLLLAVQSSLDLASHLISEEKWPPAATARGALETLEAHGVISKKTVRSLSDAVGLRNIVAHGYSGVDPAKIHLAARTGLPDLERFASEVSAWIRSKS